MLDTRQNKVVIPQEKRNRLGKPQNYHSLLIGDKAVMEGRESNRGWYSYQTTETED